MNTRYFKAYKIDDDEHLRTLISICNRCAIRVEEIDPPQTFRRRPISELTDWPEGEWVMVCFGKGGDVQAFTSDISHNEMSLYTSGLNEYVLYPYPKPMKLPKPMERKLSDVFKEISEELLPPTNRQFREVAALLRKEGR